MFIKNSLSLIRVSIVENECLFSRRKIGEFIKSGYKAFDTASNTFTNELEELYNNPNTIYRIDEREIKLMGKVFKVHKKELEHLEVLVEQNGYYFYLQCLETNRDVFQARVYGEQYVEGKRQTVFCCNCCEQVFVISGIMANFLRLVHKDFAGSIYSLEDNGTDKGLMDVLMALAREMKESEFNSLLGNFWEECYRLCENELAEYGYPTVHNFYLRANGLIKEVELKIPKLALA